jgi:cell wall-associated NlpC family hydrolase
MPAITTKARACALALAGLGVTASTMTALPATAASSGDSTDTTTTATQTRTVEKRTARHRRSARVVSAKNIAMRQRGDAYGYGAAGPGRFDCSGLVFYSYRRAGFAVPRTSSAQAGATRRIAKKDMRAGDLMFFSNGGGVYHAAIFLKWARGHAVMLHSPGPGQSVRIAVPWTSRWFGGTLRR